MNFYILPKTILKFILLRMAILLFLNNVMSLSLNQTVFHFQSLQQCRSQDYYDLNYFRCMDCALWGNDLKSSSDSKY